MWKNGIVLIDSSHLCFSASDSTLQYYLRYQYYNRRCEVELPNIRQLSLHDSSSETEDWSCYSVLGGRVSTVYSLFFIWYITTLHLNFYFFTKQKTEFL